MPTITLPQRSPRRQDYWLTRKQVADRIRAARRSPFTKHLARFLLVAVYTGSRPGTVLGLSWLPNPITGWFDLDQQLLFRRGMKARRARNKNQPVARIHARLLPHLRRWREADLVRGIVYVVSFRGRQVRKLRKSWDSVRLAAGHAGVDSPHICRHTAGTWLMQAGVDVFEASGYLGMSPETLQREYGHHSPHFQQEGLRVLFRAGRLSGILPGNPRTKNEQDKSGMTRIA